MTPLRVLFVCLGNICRSPTAEGVARTIAAAEGRADAFLFDSAGTGDWHVGAPPDPRTVAAAAARGVDLSALRARQFEPVDFERFDLILAMDRSNLRAIEAQRGASRVPARLMLDYAPGPSPRDVPDPYYGGADGFDHVLDLIEAAATALIAGSGALPKAAR